MLFFKKEKKKEIKKKIPNYRDIYFGRDKQRCAYCLKQLEYKDITVDHIIPQNLHKKMSKVINLILALLIIFIGASILSLYLNIHNINVYQDKLIKMNSNALLLFFLLIFFKHATYKLLHSKFNLVAACGECNSKKSANIDYRVIIGFVNLFFKKFFWQTLAILEGVYILKNINIDFLTSILKNISKFIVNT